MSQEDRKIGIKILRLANDDEWEEVWSLLQEYPSAYLGYRTKDTGDCLVHLASYSACELSSDCQRTALDCLRLALDREGQGPMRSCERLDHDGGTALHSALASASCLDDDYDDEEEEEGDGLEEKYSRLRCIRESVQLLLRVGGFDPNAHLINSRLVGNNECNHGGDDDDEIDAAYARDALVEGWTPLAMVILWIASLCRGNHDGKKMAEISTALGILSDLKEAGGNLDEVIAERFIVSDYIISFGYHFYHTRWNPKEGDNWVDCSCVLQIIQKILGISFDRYNAYEEDNSLAKKQLILASMLDNTNDFDRIAQMKIFEDKRQLATFPIQGVIPMPKIIYRDYFPTNLLTLAATSLSLGVFRELLKFFENEEMTENELISILTAVFTDRPSFVRSGFGKRGVAFVRKCWVEICESALNACSGDMEELLNKMLYLVCFSPWGSINALTVLIELGADANGGKTRTSSVEGEYTPIHIIAGRIRGSKATSMIDFLILKGGSIEIKDCKNRSPLQVALCIENKEVVHYLYQKSIEKEIECFADMSQRELIIFGKVAVEIKNTRMLKDCIKQIAKHSVNEQSEERDFLAEELGQILLGVLNPKFFVGCCRDECAIETLTKLFLLLKDEAKLSVVDNVSGYSCLHHILRRRIRGDEIRNALLSPVLSQLSTQNKLHLVNVRCHKDFGSYTPLHFAYVLDCQSSIDILKDFGADIEIVDGEGLSPERLRRTIISLKEHEQVNSSGDEM